jgi:hypothetical protein
VALTTLNDYRAAYESLRRRALIAARYVELGPKRPRGRRDWEHEGARLALQVAHDLYWLSFKIGSIAWNRRRVGAEPEALRREIEATRAELLAATRPLDAIEAALGPYRTAAPTPDDMLAGYLSDRRGPRHGPSGV